MKKKIKKSKRKSKKTVKWKDAEKIAALFEKAITPTAKVEHDKRLPVIGKPNRIPRQCDVVITFGKSPRNTRAIVEVQKRNNKPNIIEFHGWLKKMREVGAQQLICVSTKGFPKSIKDEVAEDIGPTVILMKLDELEENKIQMYNFWPILFHKTPNFTLESVDSNVILKKASKTNRDPVNCDINIKSSDKVFSLGSALRRKSLDEILSEGLRNLDSSQMFLQRGYIEPISYKCKLILNSTEQDLWFYIKSQKGSGCFYCIM